MSIGTTDAKLVSAISNPLNTLSDDGSTLCLCSEVVILLRTSALMAEIPDTSIRDDERASPSALMQRSEMYDNSDPLSNSSRQLVNIPFAFWTYTNAVGSVLWRRP